MFRLIAAILSALTLMPLGAGSGHAEKRLALVVGNDRYVNLPDHEQLRKAVNDAAAVGRTLKQLGFEVLSGENLRRQELVDKLDALSQRIEQGDTVFFFFSGHGVVLNGANYILPTDVPNAEPDQETRLARAALSEHDIVADLQSRGVQVAVVVLDACRTNPFRRAGVRAVGGAKGLAPPEPVRGVFSLYAAGSGQAALDRLYDGDGNPNSVFTRVLLPALERPGIDLTTLAFDVREEVARLARSAGHDQRPAYYDETTGGRVYLAGVSSAMPPLSAALSAADTPEQAWLAVQNSDSVALLEEFQRQYPHSSFEQFAAAKIEELKRQHWVVAAPPLQPALPDPALPLDMQRFDGIWTGHLACERTPEGLPGWKYELVGHINNSIFHSERGPVGNPGSETFDGKLEPDGSVKIIQKGLTGDTDRDPFHRPKGAVYGSAYAAKFDTSQGKGIRLDRSSCSLAFTRSSGGPDTPRFDGIWITTIVCPGAPPELPGRSYKFLSRVKNGELHGQMGTEGKPGWTKYDGRIESDGGVEIQAKGYVDDPKLTLGNVPGGTPFQWRALGRFDEARGNATRVSGEACTFNFVKQADNAGVRTGPAAERPRRNQ